MATVDHINWHDPDFVDTIDPGSFEQVLIPDLANAIRLGPTTPEGRQHLSNAADILDALVESAYRRWGQ